MSTRVSLTSALLLAASVLVAAPAAAQYRGGWGTPGYGSRDDDGVARDYGYREGFSAGDRDGRSGRKFDYKRNPVYRDGDLGYQGGWNRGQYRRVFRDAFEQGYNDGYYGRGRYGRGTPGYGPGYGYPDRRPATPRDRYPDYGRDRYPDYGRGYPGYPGRGGVYSPAWDKGLSDGYEKGLDDGRDNDRFDPLGEKWYRQGDRGYRREYGSKDAYKNAYRDAFRQGYERGYQEGRGGYGSAPRGRWPF